MKKLLLILFVSTFLMSCVKESMLNNVPVEEQLLSESALAPVVIGGPLENPLPNLNDLPASVLTLVNGSYTQQYSNQTLPDITPNSANLYNNVYVPLTNLFLAMRCPLPQPPPNDHATIVGGNNPLPGCPIIPIVFAKISFRFNKISATQINLVIRYNPTNVIIYTKSLFKTGVRQYTKPGFMITNHFTNQEVSNYSIAPSQLTITPIVRKFFDFFNTSLITSN